MRKAIYMITALLLSAFQLTSCAQSKQNEEKNADMKNKKVLVALYSRAGENYAVGNVKVGNTQVLAEEIAAQTGGTLFQIKPVKAYPEGYDECTRVAKTEKESGARPEIVDDTNVEDYDVIFIGYPNWWSDAPMPVYTFIEKHNWQGKTVIPFCTHEGSGLNNSAQIEAAVQGATVLEGLGMYGHKAQKQREEAKKEVQKWLKGLGF